MPPRLDSGARPRAIGYIRVSSVGGRAGAEYHTLDVQRASIERVCEQRGYELIAVHTDENRSGKSRKRPEFARVMDRVMSGEADAVAVWKVSRFSRNWAEAAEDTERLLRAGKDLISGEEGFDTTTTGGRALLRMLFVLAAWEREVLNEGWEVVKAKVVRERGATLGHAGLGYRSGEGGRLERDPETDWIVATIFERRADGESLGSLAKYLNEVKPRPRSVWSVKDVRRILGRRAYVGEARWRETVLPGAHEALVSEDLFARANAVQVEAPPPSRSPRREFPLSSWLRCDSCGGPMSGSVDTDYRTGRRRPSYKCSRRRKGCPRPVSIGADVVEEFAMSEMDALMGSVALEAVDAANGKLGRAQAKLAEIDDALAEVASIEMRRVLGEDWLPTMIRLRREKVDVEAEIAAERRAAGLPALVRRWADLEAADRWAALRSAVDALVVLPSAPGRKPVDRLLFVTNDGHEADPVAS